MERLSFAHVRLGAYVHVRLVYALYGGECQRSCA